MSTMSLLSNVTTTTAPVEKPDDTEHIRKQRTGVALAKEHAKAGKINALAYTFYGVAVAGAIGGQAWVATEQLPWPVHTPPWVPWAVGVGLAVVLELLGVVTASMADWRRRLGEEAYGLMAFSGLIATAATATNVLGHVLGHEKNLYAAAGFGLLSASAYVLYLFHSAMRRRDALRGRNAMAPPAPVYGWRQWRAEPEVTRRAKLLAEANPSLGVHGSLTAARAAVRLERRQKAIATALRAKLARSVDPLTATIAVHTYDLDQIAAHLAGEADYDGLTALIAADITPVLLTATANRAATKHRAVKASADDKTPTSKTTRRTTGRATGVVTGRPSMAERVTKAVDKTPTASAAQIAAKLGVSERTVQRHLPKPGDASVATVTTKPTATAAVTGGPALAATPA